MTTPLTQHDGNRLAMLGGSRSVPRGLRIAPWPVVTEDDKAAVRRVLASARFTSASVGEPEIPALESEWAAYVGTSECVAVSNGTTAIAIALAARGVGPADEVIVPALSFIATAMAPLHVLSVPVFSDIDPVTFNVNPAAIEAAITPRTRAIVVVHLHGLPADMSEIRAIAARHNLLLVEDAAQAQGAQYQGRRAGALADLGAFSLNVSKNLATCGEGGLITTDDPGWATRARMLRQFGEMMPTGGERSYVSHLAGWNSKPNALQAAFARSQLARFAGECESRDANIRRLLTRVGQVPGFLPPAVPPGRTHAWHILRFRVDPHAFGLTEQDAGPLRAAVQRALRAEGVPAAPYQLMPLAAQPVFREQRSYTGGPWPMTRTPYRPEDFPHTLRVLEDSFTIQKAHLHPQAGPLLDSYADAFEKIWEQREAIRAYATTMPYTTPWEAAERIARAEWSAAFGQT